MRFKPFALMMAGMLAIGSLSGCGALLTGEGILSDKEVDHMRLTDANGNYLTYVDVFRERGSGRDYYYYNGVKEYVDTGPGTGLNTRGTINRNR